MFSCTRGRAQDGRPLTDGDAVPCRSPTSRRLQRVMSRRRCSACTGTQQFVPPIQRRAAPVQDSHAMRQPRFLAIYENTPTCLFGSSLCVNHFMKPSFVGARSCSVAAAGAPGRAQPRTSASASWRRACPAGGPRWTLPKPCRTPPRRQAPPPARCASTKPDPHLSSPLTLLLRCQPPQHRLPIAPGCCWQLVLT